MILMNKPQSNRATEKARDEGVEEGGRGKRTF
jgi:hypothetical protein